MIALDAVDCLFAFGYKIKKAPAPPGGIFLESLPVFKLCNADADMSYKKSIGLLLQEIDENKEYYARRIIEIGKELL